MLVWIYTTRHGGDISLSSLKLFDEGDGGRASLHVASAERPGNDEGEPRQKQLAYPSEYSRWGPSHLCWASYILASASTDERVGTAEPQQF